MSSLPQDPSAYQNLRKSEIAESVTQVVNKGATHFFTGVSSGKAPSGALPYHSYQKTTSRELEARIAEELSKPGSMESRSSLSQKVVPPSPTLKEIMGMHKSQISTNTGLMSTSAKEQGVRESEMLGAAHLQALGSNSGLQAASGLGSVMKSFVEAASAVA